MVNDFYNSFYYIQRHHNYTISNNDDNKNIFNNGNNNVIDKYINKSYIKRNKDILYKMDWVEANLVCNCY